MIAVDANTGAASLGATPLNFPLHLMLAIQRAQAAGFTHLAGALSGWLRAEQSTSAAGQNRRTAATASAPAGAALTGAAVARARETRGECPAADQARRQHDDAASEAITEGRLLPAGRVNPHD